MTVQSSSRRVAMMLFQTGDAWPLYNKLGAGRVLGRG
jgi:hypothetical protein